MNKPTDKGMIEIMKHAQELQKKLKVIQDQVSGIEITGESGGGMVKVRVTGQHLVVGVTFDSNLLKEAKSVIEDLFAAAMNDATNKIEKYLRDKMGGLAGVKLPNELGDLSESE